MKRLTLCLSLALCLGPAACEDEESPPTTPPATADAAARDAAGIVSDAAGGDTAADAGSASGMCKGLFASVSRPALTAVTNPAGKCSSSGDLDLVCNGVAYATTAACGISCYQTAPAMINACTKDCVLAKNKLSLSEGCTDCYVGLLVCGAENCASACANPSDATCTACLVSAKCISNFLGCSGLPGGAPASDGGTGSDASGGSDARDAASTTDSGSSPDAAAVDAAAVDAAAVDAANVTVDAAGTAVDAGTTTDAAGTASDASASD